MTLQQVKDEMNDPSSWVSLLGNFRYEKALSDFIANYPNHLEDGLLPHSNSKIRERVFKDNTRLDVLLIDRQGMPVIVECKQNAPSLTRRREGLVVSLLEEEETCPIDALGTCKALAEQEVEVHRCLVSVEEKYSEELQEGTVPA